MGHLEHVRNKQVSMSMGIRKEEGDTDFERFQGKRRYICMYEVWTEKAFIQI